MDLGGGESVVLHSHSTAVHYPPSRHTLDIEENRSHPKAVMRGFCDLDKVEAGVSSVMQRPLHVVATSVVVACATCNVYSDSNTV